MKTLGCNPGCTVRLGRTPGSGDHVVPGQGAILQATREWWNGRHARLRTWSLRGCGFDSRLAHTQADQRKRGGAASRQALGEATAAERRDGHHVRSSASMLWCSRTDAGESLPTFDSSGHKRQQGLRTPLPGEVPFLPGALL